MKNLVALIILAAGGAGYLYMNGIDIGLGPDGPGAGMSVATPDDGRGAEVKLASRTTEGDPVITYGADDTTMNEAIAAARESLPGALGIMIAPPEGVSDFSLKVGVAHDGGVEHMWMSHCSMGFERFRCSVANDGVAVALKPGDDYSFAPEAISDWMYRADGRIHGGYTIRAMLPRLPQDQAEALSAQLAPLN